MHTKGFNQTIDYKEDPAGSVCPHLFVLFCGKPKIGLNKVAYLNSKNWSGWYAVPFIIELKIKEQEINLEVSQFKYLNLGQVFLACRWLHCHTHAN